MGSNIQVDFMMESLPLAVPTQRCARTSELTRRRDFTHHSLLITHHRDSPPPLASNELFGGGLG
jgi:hypothetical protein